MQTGNISDIDRRLNYELVKQIEEHAKRYNTAFDKKRFLKNVSPYEQKYILINSNDPFDVLMYLDEIDSKDTRLLLSELNQDEIKKIINLLSCEQKKLFYNSFTNLELVNKFIKYDKNAKEHIQDLEFERKVEIIDASTKVTAEASSVMYESMEDNEKQIVLDMITDVDAIVALKSTDAYQVSAAEQTSAIEQTEASQTEETNALLNPTEDLTQEFKKQEEIKENKPGEEKEKINELLKTKDDKTKQSLNPEKNITFGIKPTQNLGVISNQTRSTIVKEFNDLKNECEQDIINQIQADFQNAIFEHAMKK